MEASFEYPAIEAQAGELEKIEEETILAFPYKCAPYSLIWRYLSSNHCKNLK